VEVRNKERTSNLEGGQTARLPFFCKILLLAGGKGAEIEKAGHNIDWKQREKTMGYIRVETILERTKRLMWLSVLVLFLIGLVLGEAKADPKTWEFGLAELEGYSEFSFSAESDQFGFSFSGYGYYPAGDLSVILEDETLETESLFKALSSTPVVFEKTLKFPTSLTEEPELKFRATAFGSTGATLNLYLQKTSQSLLWGTPKEKDMLLEGLGESGVEISSLTRGPARKGEDYIYYGKTYMGFESDSRVRVYLEGTEQEDYTFAGGSKYEGDGSALTGLPSGPMSVEVEGGEKIRISAGGEDHIHLLLDGVGLNHYSVPEFNSSAYHNYEEFSLAAYYREDGVRKVEMEGS